jgi:riboflavin synthase
MFTGLTEEMGRIKKIQHLAGNAVRIEVAGERILQDTELGDSIAVNGVCLTVAELGADSFTSDVMGETLTHTSVGNLDVGSYVNLERAAAASSRLGGHIVQGHVDGTGQLIELRSAEHWRVLRFSIPSDLAGYVVHKGSITIDGVSLTVSAVSIPTGEPAPNAKGIAGAKTTGTHWLEVSLIPLTQSETTLGGLAIGERVNLEVDVIAKYVARLLEVGQT